MKTKGLFVLWIGLAACGGAPNEVASSAFALDYIPDEIEGGEGGGGGGGSVPAPSMDTSASKLDAEARAYLAQAGVAEETSVGGTMWVNACRVRAQQGAVTFTSGVTRSCQWSNVNPGWIILEVAYDVIKNKNDRGSASISAMNGPSTVSRVEFGSKFNGAISLAQKAGIGSAEVKLQLEYQRLNGYYAHFDGAGNQVYAEVTANGGVFEGSDIEIQARAKLLRIY